MTDVVKSFLYARIRGKNVVEIDKMYERLIEEFKDTHWPPVNAPLAEDDDYIFCLLYREMWYRHLSSPTLYQRLHSWHNYCLLFQFVLSGEFTMHLPCQWLWDIVDGFVNQFHSFSIYRACHRETHQFVALLKLNHEAWSVYRVLKVLRELVKSSLAHQVLDQAKVRDLHAALSNLHITEIEDESNALMLLGCFSMVGLSRVYCLLGDYEAGLDCLPPIDTSHQGLYTVLIACHVTTIYLYGFANLMLGRYADAIREFNKFLVYIFKAMQPLQESPQHEQILIKIDQVYALLAICLSLCPPQIQLIDENVSIQLTQKFGQKKERMQRYDDNSFALYSELLLYAWPTFGTPFEPSSGDPREIFTQEELALFENGEKILSIAYPTLFGPSASSHVWPIVKHKEKELALFENGEEILSIAYPTLFGPSASSHVWPVVKHTELAAVIHDMLKPTMM